MGESANTRPRVSISSEVQPRLCSACAKRSVDSAASKKQWTQHGGCWASRRLSPAAWSAGTCALLGAALDSLIRHRLPLAYISGGQRVPEDLHVPNAAYLIDRALKGGQLATPHALGGEDWPLFAGVEAERAEHRTPKGINTQKGTSTQKGINAG